MTTSVKEEVKQPEDRFNEIIDTIEARAMACDGPVTPTLQAATEEELSQLWELINEMSPKRKAIRERILKGNETNEDAREYLRQEGLDPDVVGKVGVAFVKSVSERIDLKKQNHELLEALRDIKEVATKANGLFLQNPSSENVELHSTLFHKALQAITAISEKLISKSNINEQ